jgi:hypothetical protein
VKEQLPSPLQMSLAQARPSSQVYAVPPHEPAAHTSFFVQAFPSSHAVPDGTRLQEPWLELGLQTWHWFAGLLSPSAWQEPSITQLPGFGE